MLVVKVGATNYVESFDVMTQAAYYANATFVADTTRYFVDRTAFYSDTEVGQFMTSPQSYYIDSAGILRRDYGDSSNDVDFSSFVDMYAIKDAIPN